MSVALTLYVETPQKLDLAYAHNSCADTSNYLLTKYNIQTSLMQDIN